MKHSLTAFLFCTVLSSGISHPAHAALRIAPPQGAPGEEQCSALESQLDQAEQAIDQACSQDERSQQCQSALQAGDALYEQYEKAGCENGDQGGGGEEGDDQGGDEGPGRQ